MKSLAPGAHHGSAVAFDDFGILILGASGSGKSELALRLIDKGACLIADDVVELGATLSLYKPKNGPSLLEIRKLALFNAPVQERATLKLIVDLDSEEQMRLPPLRHTRIGDERVVLIAGKAIPNLDTILKHYVAYGRVDPD